MRFSTRAKILNRVLGYFNEEKYEDYGYSLQFGDGIGEFEESFSAASPKFRKFIGVASEYLASTAARERTSLVVPPPPPELNSLVAELSAMMQRTGQTTAETTAKRDTELRSERDIKENTTVIENCDRASNPTDDIDDLDRYFANEVLFKLEEIVRRAASLYKVPTFIVPNKRVQVAFEQAHRCYLYGFDLSCAVFCRALLESSLEEVVGRDDEGRKSIEGMLQKDGSRILKHDRPALARTVATAGHLAVHEPDEFLKRYPAAKVAALLDNTRKVLQALYSAPE